MTTNPDADRIEPGTRRCVDCRAPIHDDPDGWSSLCRDCRTDDGVREPGTCKSCGIAINSTGDPQNDDHEAEFCPKCKRDNEWDGDY